MTAPELTQEMIAEGMARADKVACSPGDGRCYPFRYSLQWARESCTPKGRCKIGGTRRVIAADSGRKTWDVWLDIKTGEGRLRKTKG